MTASALSEVEERALRRIRAEGFSDEDLEAARELVRQPEALALRRPIPSIREFVESPHYLGAEGRLYPEVLEALEAINDGEHVECVLTGGTSTGKTTIAVYSIAYQTWVVGCYEDPHALFGLDPASEIEFVFQSINLKLADEVGYERFRNLVRAAPCFRDYFRPDSKIQSKLKFPRNVVVKPVVGEVTGAMGQNVIGGVVDEMNFMEVVERSAKTQGERYDQATALYSTIARRREGRFLQRGGMLPGMLCLVSSANYRGAFIDRKVQEARENSRIYVWDKPQWGVTRPTERYSGETFRVFRGDDARRPRILTDDEAVGEGDEVLVLDAPVEHRASFESDLLGALRDVAGVPTDAVHPFIARPDAVAGVFGARPSIFSRESVDFEAEALKLYPGRIEDPDEPRAIHVDLGAVSDSAGVAIGYCPGFARIERGPGEFEVLPRARFDALLEVRVPRGGEIDFERIRSVIYRLADKGVRIGWVTFDSWQSRDSIQQLRRRGFRAGVLSMDRAPQGKKPGGIDHWMLARGALYDERVEAPDHEKCRRELLRLELDAVHRKIDHPPGGSSDVAQAFGAVIAKLHRARETWSRWRIPVTSGSPVGTHEDEVREGAPERPRPGGSTRPGRRRTR